jgi:hypothetical protein
VIFVLSRRRRGDGREPDQQEQPQRIHSSTRTSRNMPASM